MHTAAEAVEYPYSDGRPMAESEAHLRALLYLLAALYAHFREREDVYVGGDMFIYHERDNLEAAVAPDVFVVRGAAKRADNPRLSYKLWEEPKGPDFVLEVASRSTWVKDRDAHSGEADHRIRCEADHSIRSSRSPVGAKRRGGSIMPFSDRLGSMKFSSFAWILP